MKKEAIVVLLLWLLLGSSAAFCGQDHSEKYRLVFSTFDVSSAGNYVYLRDGIQSMLVSRLAARDNIEVIDRAVDEREWNRLKAEKEKKDGEAESSIADFLVEGALYSLKSGLNVQVVMYPIAADKDILRFSIITNTPDTLIADVDQLVGEMVQAIDGKSAVTPVGETKESETGQAKGFVTAHPEAAYKRGQYSGSMTGIPGSMVQTTSLGGKRNINIPVEMTGMTIADVDGDGVGEMIVVSGSRLELYKLDGKSIDKVTSTSLSRNLRIHSINAADLDNDGRPEIYISATADLDVASLIIRWDKEKGFFILSQDIRWYIRPLSVPGKGWRLVGQKRGLEKAAFVREGIYLLDLDKRFEPREGGRLALPPKINLFDFVYADLDGDGHPETVAIDRRERMKVFNQSNELLWVSDRNFGGSKIYLGPSYGEAINKQDRRNLSVNEDSDRELVFVPGRMVVTDVDRDGREEIVVNENTRPKMGFVGTSVVSLFSRLKTYTEGTIVGLAWNGDKMNEIWRTGRFRGYIADHGFSMLAKPPTEAGQVVVWNKENTYGRLFVGSIPNSGSFVSLLPGSDNSELTVYDIEFSHEKSK